MSKKVCITTLGCRANQADSNDIAGYFSSNGYAVAERCEKADVCVINTCTVTSGADADCRNKIRAVRKKNPKARIIITGCLARVAADDLKRMSEVDDVWGSEWRAEALRYNGRNFTRNVAEPPRTPLIDRTRPLVKIQDGCDRFCAYCIVPFARGGNKSMPKDEVLRRVLSIKDSGYSEAVLTGIHLGGYGKDLSPKETLVGLLKDICATAGKGFRIRLSSIDPDEWTDELLDLVTKEPAICPHFHIPLQSGDDEILKKMKRRYNTVEFKSLVSKLKKKLPDSAIGADVIVGFPGETNAHFEGTRRFIEGLDIAYLHVFSYSRRTGTAADKMSGQVPEREKKRRADILRKISEEKRAWFVKSQVGKKLRVVIEAKRDKKTGKLKGVSENYIPVLLDGGDEMMKKQVDVKFKMEG